MKPTVELGLAFALALEKGDIDTVDTLIKNKVYDVVRGFDLWGNPIWEQAILFVAEKGHPNMMTTLLSGRSKLDLCRELQFDMSKNPAVVAVQHNQVNILRELLNSSIACDVYIFRGFMGSTLTLFTDPQRVINYVLHYAVSSGKHEIVREILKSPHVTNQNSEFCMRTNISSIVHALEPSMIDILAEYICEQIISQTEYIKMVFHKYPDLVDSLRPYSPQLWVALQNQMSTMGEEEYFTLLKAIYHSGSQADELMQHPFYKIFSSKSSISSVQYISSFFYSAEPEPNILERIKITLNSNECGRGPISESVDIVIASEAEITMAHPSTHNGL